MSEITITVPGDPKGQPRPRFSRCGGFVKVYNPDAKLDARIKAIIAEQVDFEPISTAIEATVIYYFKPPKSTSKKNLKMMLDNEIKHVKRPDGDNCLKKTLDCCNASIYVDDSQIWKMTAEKRYSEEPMTVITLKY